MKDRKMKCKKATVIDYWKDYLKEKRPVICLYLITAVTFWGLACLYRLENLPKIGYGVVLTACFWIFAGIFYGRRYVEKRKRISMAQEHPDNVWEFLIRERKQREGGAIGALEEGEGAMLENAYISLIETLCDRDRRRQDIWEEKSREQSDYYMMWAHQIKTPISAMKLLLNGQSAGQKESFLLQEELFKIEQYVEMVLHFQRLETMSQDMVLKEYDLYGLLKQAVKKYSVLFINSAVRLELEPMQMRTVTDDKWFSFCVEQILSNSIKYTAQARGLAGREPKEGTVSLYIQEAEPDTLVIGDNGIGIRQEDLPRIFERGFTGYNGRMDKKATGIGLYLSKRILDRLGNTIRVESVEGAGTRVYITLVTKQELDYG